MSFRKTGYANSESAPIRMCARFVEPSNKLHQVDRVVKRISRFVVRSVMGPIAPECKNVPDCRLSVSKQNVFDLFFIVANAGQMRDWIQFCSVLNALDEIVS